MFDDTYKRVKYEITLLNRDWNTFHQLFVHGDERMQLLHNVASGFFRIVQDTLAEAVFIKICRLTDPPKSSGKVNLSFYTLLLQLQHTEYSELYDALQTQLDKVIEKSKPVRDYRNKQLAHLDLNITLRKSEEALAPIPRGLIDKIVTDLNTMIKVLVTEIEEIPYSPDQVVFIGTAEDLVFYIEQGYKT